MTFLFHCLTEIVEVIGKSLFLLTDVEFFDIIYQFLLKTVFVILHLGDSI